jgi:hypothetical protein
MDYYGSYEKPFEEEDRKAMEIIEGNNEGECTLFTAYGSHALYGRNLDVASSIPLLLITHPARGYASVSMSNIDYLGFSNIPGHSLPPLEQRVRLLSVPYYTWDGMNEWGLAVAAANVPSYGREYVDPAKPSVNGLYIRRLILDNARNTEEAISLLQKYNVTSAGTLPIHLMIADPSGISAVVEFIDGEMKIIRNTYPYQVAANFYLSNLPGSTEKKGLDRYNAVLGWLKEEEGSITPEEAMDILKKVSVKNTAWSIVYDMGTGEVYVSVSRDYENIKRFSIPLRD